MLFSFDLQGRFKYRYSNLLRFFYSSSLTTIRAFMVRMPILRFQVPQQFSRVIFKQLETNRKCIYKNFVTTTQLFSVYCKIESPTVFLRLDSMHWWWQEMGGTRTCVLLRLNIAVTQSYTKIEQLLQCVLKEFKITQRGSWIGARKKGKKVGKTCFFLFSELRKKNETNTN